jgi:hypothetical protein
VAAQQPHYPAEETARRGDEIYERMIRAQVETTHHGKVVAIDVDSGTYTIDETALAAARQLRARCPDAVVWFVRVGHRALHRVGGRPSATRR